MDRHQLAGIAERYGFSVPESVPLPWTGATSRVYPCGDVVIKIALDNAEARRSLEVDAAMNPVARDLGVQSAELVAFDDTESILPAPYAVYRRVQDALPLDDFTGSTLTIQEAWKAVGRDLALVHQVPYGTEMPVSLREFRQTPEVDPRPWVDELRERGALDVGDAGWLHTLLETLAPSALADVPLTLCHGDVNASNILVDATTGGYRALIDWAGAGWLDPVWDFVAVPLSVVPWLLAGHRDVAPLTHDETAEARILWCQAQTRLHAARAIADLGDASTRLARDVAALREFAGTQGWA